MQGTIAWALGISRWAVTERPKQPAHGAQEAFLALLALYLAAVRGGGLQFGRLLCRERGVHAAEASGSSLPRKATGFRGLRGMDAALSAK